MKDRTPSIPPSIAKMIDHSLLHPTLTDQDMARGCEVGKKYGVAAVVVKPYAVGMAAEILKGTDVAVCAVVGFPHGSSRIEVKVEEAKLACRDGATELDMVVNVNPPCTTNLLNFVFAAKAASKCSGLWSPLMSA